MPARLSADAPEWYVISLRPRGEHAALRRAAKRRGAGFIALSPWVLRDRDDDATRDALRTAMAAPLVVVTSPAAVRAAARLQALHARRDQSWFAVGATTAAALRLAGIKEVSAPARMDSEGLLAMPGLHAVQGRMLGLITAPGGRGVLIPALEERGAQVLRADVYERVPIPPPARAVARLRAMAVPAVLVLSSDEALRRMVSSLPADVVAKLRATAVVAASRRLADLARGHGFRGEIAIARGPRPRDLIAAIDEGAFAAEGIPSGSMAPPPPPA